MISNIPTERIGRILQADDRKESGTIMAVQLDPPLAPAPDTDSEGRRQSRPSFRQLRLRLGIGKQPG